MHLSPAELSFQGKPGHDPAQDLAEEATEEAVTTGRPGVVWGHQLQLTDGLQ